MDRLIYTAMTGATQTMNRQAAVAHNLANVSSTGYRAEEHRLRAVQVQTQNAPAALPTRSFVVDASTHNDMSSGPLQYTGRDLDLAIQGKGWLSVMTPTGEAYTRNGNLQIDANGVIRTMGGLQVLSDSGPITIPPDQKVEVGVDGTVSVIPQSGLQTSSTVGRLKMVNPPDANLVRGADGMFRLRTGVPAPLDETVKVSPRYLEGSNVNPVEQMVSMISLARQFEMQIKMVSNAETNDRAATQILAASR